MPHELLTSPLHAPSAIAAWSESGRDDAAALVHLVPEIGDNGASVRIEIAAGSREARPTFVALRWNVGELPAGIQILGDHWERGYGDLEWRGLVAERVLPWYCLLHDTGGGRSWGFGVETGAASIASWRVDAGGVTLVLDIRNGGSGVVLGDRVLSAATVHALESSSDESAFAFARRFCRRLCPSPRLPRFPVYGGNDWYFRYGRISAETVRQDASLIRELSPSTENAPFFVIDDGWFPKQPTDARSPYERGNDRFPDMAELAADLKRSGVRPGIWIRPLMTPSSRIPESWKVGPGHPHAGRANESALDPSVPEVLELVAEDMARVTREWGFELVKHDFTTYEICGRWGFQMGDRMTESGWAFADRTRTTAEIIRALYQILRDAAGDAVLIGCNTVGHLGAGLFELQRTGDDTSGRVWERTRKMGVNTLAFRMPQQETFFAVDADCVGLTPAIPWERNRQWLDLLGRSGTPLFVSADPAAVGNEQRAALREAFDRAAISTAPAEPLDWLDDTCPRRWRFGDGETVTYDWNDFAGSAFLCPP